MNFKILRQYPLVYLSEIYFCIKTQLTRNIGKYFLKRLACCLIKGPVPAINTTFLGAVEIKASKLDTRLFAEVFCRCFRH